MRMGLLLARLHAHFVGIAVVKQAVKQHSLARNEQQQQQ